MDKVDVSGILGRAGADADAPEGSQARSLAQAVCHVTRTLYAAEVASQDAIVSALSQGVAVVDANAAPTDEEGE